MVAVNAISFLTFGELTDDFIVDSLNRVTSRLAACASALAYMLYFRRHCSTAAAKRRTAIPHVGRSGVGASRHYSGNFVADYRTLRINWICAGWSRSASLCTPSALLARLGRSKSGMDFRRFRMAAVCSRIAVASLYAADHHYALPLLTARTAGGGGIVVELTRTLAGPSAPGLPPLCGPIVKCYTMLSSRSADYGV